jgi:uncharacterized protein (TIGR02598 family)
MHKRIPAEDSAKALPRVGFTRRTRAGFSLVEVALAIAIVAFAFIALIGLLPTGMQVFRGSMDTANENWIMQDINSILQTTPWSSVDGMAAGGADAILFAYDDEGKVLERVKAATVEPGGDHPDWQYIVKLLVDPVNRPNTESDRMPDCRLVTVVIAPYGKRKAVEEFNELTSSSQLIDKETIGKKSDVRLRSFVITRMDSVYDK